MAKKQTFWIATIVVALVVIWAVYSYMSSKPGVPDISTATSTVN